MVHSPRTEADWESLKPGVRKLQLRENRADNDGWKRNGMELVIMSE
jgi:hypothetical protein